MKKTIKNLSVIISDCISDEELSTITVCFQSVETKGAVFMQPLTFKVHKYDKEACDFFRNFPVFTKEGSLDYECLKGNRAYLNLIDRGNGWEIISADYDYLYYGVELEQDRADFQEEVYEK